MDEEKNPIYSILRKMKLHTLKLNNLSQEEVSERFVSMFANKCVSNEFIGKHMPSYNEICSLMKQKVPYFAFDVRHPTIGGLTYFKDNSIHLNPYIINTIDKMNHIAFHEMLHAYTQTQTHCGVMRKRDQENNVSEFGRGLNEGITEYIIEKILPSKQKLFLGIGFKFSCSGGYSMEQTIAKELAVLVGKENMLADYFSNTPINNMYKEIYKYDIHNEARNFSEGITFQHMDSSRKSLMEIMKQTDVINSIKENDLIRSIAFREVHKVIYKLMEQQFEYARQPGNEQEMSKVEERFTELYKVFPKFKGNKKLNLANLHPDLAKKIDQEMKMQKKEILGEKIKGKFKFLQREETKALAEKNPTHMNQTKLSYSAQNDIQREISPREKLINEIRGTTSGYAQGHTISTPSHTSIHELNNNKDGFANDR